MPSLRRSLPEAYELLAMFHWMSGGWMVEAAVGQKNVYAAATKALAIDPTLAAAASFAETSRPEGVELDW